MNQEELLQEHDRRMHVLKIKEDEQKEDGKIVDQRPLSPEAESARERMAKRKPEIERLQREYLRTGSGR